MRLRSGTPIWLWFNILSLDAPLIALVWQDFLARCYPAALSLSDRVVLGLTVWAIYLTDRLLDVRHPESAGDTARHAFHRRHRTLLRTILAGIIAADMFLAYRGFSPAILVSGVVLAGVVAAYLAVFAYSRRGVSALKKPLAAMLFTSGVFLIAWAAMPRPGRLGWAAIAFFALCFGNLLMIERWERGHSGLAVWIPLLLAGVPIVWIPASVWFAAILVSAAALAALARWGHRMPIRVRCVLADAALLSPLLFR
jgi:hypothetical protein